MAERLTKEQEDALRQDAAEEVASEGTWSIARSRDVKGAYDIVVTYPEGTQLCAGHMLSLPECQRVIRARETMPAVLAEIDALRSREKALVDAIEAIQRADDESRNGYEWILGDVRDAVAKALVVAREGSS